MSPPPKDPIKYGLYIQRQSESHKGQISARKGVTLSQETKDKMSLSKQGMYDGEKNPFYNKKHTQESLKLINIAANNRDDEWRKKISESSKGRTPWNKGISPSELTRIKSSESQKGEKSHRYGKHNTKEHNNKISESLKNKPKPEIVCKKISQSRLGKCRGEKNPNWNGGSSQNGYCYKNNVRRHRAVSRFYGYRCICCGKHESENITAKGKQKRLSIHHVDHNREQGCNGIPFNLVPLCLKCHALELHNQEAYKKYINHTIEEGYKWGIWSREQYEIEVMYPE